jgi:hypothetical protein
LHSGKLSCPPKAVKGDFALWHAIDA